MEVLVLPFQLHRLDQPYLPSKPDIELEERGLIGHNSVEGAEEARCVKAQIARSPNGYQVEDRTCTVQWTPEMDIKPYLLGQIDRQNSSSSAAWQLQGEEQWRSALQP